MPWPADPQAAQQCQVSAGHDQVCITCSDQVVTGQVITLLGNGMAHVDTGQGLEEVCLDLVEAAVGDMVLVHAKVAIGKV